MANRLHQATLMSVCSLIVISIVKPMATYNKKYVFCLFCLIADEEK